MPELNHAATLESLKPLMTHNDSAVSSVDDVAIFSEKSVTSMPQNAKNAEFEIMILEETDSSGSSESDNSSFFSSIVILHSRFETFLSERQSQIKKIVLGVLGALYAAYFSYALYLHFTLGCDVSAVPLIAVTGAAMLLFLISYFTTRFSHQIQRCTQVLEKAVRKRAVFLKWFSILVVYGGVIAVIGLTVYQVPANLVSLAGIVTFIIILFLCSAHPKQVRWRPVIGGITLQFYFAVLILKWDIGYKVFSFLGNEIQKFLSFTDEGSEFVFGKKYTDHIFAMKVLPVIIFFSCFISILYYLGVMQKIIGVIAFVMRSMLGTTAAESLCAAGNIFVGQTEAPILIRPYLSLMTKSELHAVMVGGFATIAGGVLAAYVAFGVPAEHLLCASVMNAPCALAVSKLLHPEVEESKLKKVTDIDIEDKESKPRNLLEAAAGGASSAICLVANIAANLIAFLALLAFVNAMLSWFGSFVCYPDLSFQRICSYAFMPIAYLMGVPWKDAGVVGELIGIKTFLNEFVAYKELAKYITNRKDCVEGTTISIRSEVIATYALCGFSNLSSIGIQLGGLGPMAPKRMKDMANIVVRALMGGIIACLLTACMAGLLMEVHDSVIDCSNLNSTNTNSTLISTNSTLISTLLNTTAENMTNYS